MLLRGGREGGVDKLPRLDRGRETLLRRGGGSDTLGGRPMPLNPGGRVIDVSSTKG